MLSNVSFFRISGCENSSAPAAPVHQPTHLSRWTEETWPSATRSTTPRLCPWPLKSAGLWGVGVVEWHGGQLDVEGENDYKHDWNDREIYCWNCYEGVTICFQGVAIIFIRFAGQLMVNCWFGARWFGFLEFPLWKGLLLTDIPRIPNHRNPNDQFANLPLADDGVGKKKSILEVLLGQIYEHFSRKEVVIHIWSRLIIKMGGKTSWWFQAIWKIFVKLNHFPKVRGEMKNPWNHLPKVSKFSELCSSFCGYQLGVHRSLTEKMTAYLKPGDVLSFQPSFAIQNWSNFCGVVSR